MHITSSIRRILLITTASLAPFFAHAATGDLAEGEVRKIDTENKKITLKHGEIKNLDMPGMTMVFQVQDPALLQKVKVGDKVRFAAEKSGGAIVVTNIEPAP
jgi:Cu/Ag efflux protein CusF